MTHEIVITAPVGFDEDPRCSHCGEEIGDHLAGLYPASEPNRIGGEHACPSCDGPIVVSVFFPAPLYAASVPIAFDENVRFLHARRRR